MSASGDTTEATLCELCGTMLRASAPSAAAARASLDRQWENHLLERHAAELGRLDGSLLEPTSGTEYPLVPGSAPEGEKL